MIGFNGGLIGGLPTARATSTAPTVPGVWTLPEQRNAKLALLWPTSGLKLLDAYPGAAAAYSLRSLSNSYTGNLITVRRSSDSTTQSFTQQGIEDGSLVTFCGAGNGFITTWFDQSGNGNNATQSTTSIQPQIVTTGVVDKVNSNKPCLTYGGNGDFNLNMTTRRTDIVSVFEVLKVDFGTTTNATNFILGDSATNNYASSENGTGSWLDSGQASAAVRTGSNRINNAIADFTTTPKTTNPTLISMIHAGTAAVSQITQDRTQTNRSLRGRMQEIILYSSAQTANVAGINADINTYYSIY